MEDGVMIDNDDVDVGNGFGDGVDNFSVTASPPQEVFFAFDCGYRLWRIRSSAPFLFSALLLILLRCCLFHRFCGRCNPERFNTTVP